MRRKQPLPWAGICAGSTTNKWRVARCHATSPWPGHNLTSLQLISLSSSAVSVRSLVAKRWPTSIHDRLMMTLRSGRLANLVADSDDHGDDYIRKTLPRHAPLSWVYQKFRNHLSSHKNNFSDKLRYRGLSNRLKHTNELTAAIIQPPI